MAVATSAFFSVYTTPKNKFGGFFVNFHIVVKIVKINEVVRFSLDLLLILCLSITPTDASLADFLSFSAKNKTEQSEVFNY